MQLPKLTFVLLDFSLTGDASVKVDATSDYEFWPYEHAASIDAALSGDAVVTSTNCYTQDASVKFSGGGTDTYLFHTPLNYQHDADIGIKVSLDSVVDGPELMEAALTISGGATIVFEDGRGAEGAVSLRSLTTTGYGLQSIGVTGGGELPLLESSGIGHSSLNAVSLSSLETSGQSFSTISLSGGGTLPRIESSGLAHSSLNVVEISGLTATGSSLTGTLATGGGALPKLESAGVGRVDGTATAELRLGSLTTSGSAFATTVASGAGSLPLPSSTGAVEVGIGVTSTDISLGSLTTSGSSWTAITATGAGDLVLFIGSGAVIVGDSTSRLFVAMNLGNAAVTEYEDWTFDSLVAFNGQLLGASASGISVIGGVLDNATHIDAYIETGLTDHGTEESKRPTDAYVGFKTPGAMDLTVTGKVKGRDDSFIYLVGPGNDENETAKAPVGRGFESRYLKYKLANRAGEDFAIDTLTVLAQVTGRRK